MSSLNHPRYSQIDPSVGKLRRRVSNRLMLSLAGLLTVLALVPLFWIVGFVIYKGSGSINLEFFTELPRPLGVTGGGVLPAIEGTVIMTMLACLFAIPPALLAAIYAARHPNTWLGIALRFSTDVLSGVPSIVIGLFCYAVVVKQQGHYSGVAGAISLAIIMLPVILRTTEEMVKLVPHSIREASLALGAPEWKTSLSVILPAAVNGILTGVLLGIARAAGETAPLLFTALGNERFEVGRLIQNGLTSGSNIFEIFSVILSQPMDSLPLKLWKYAQQPYPERVEQSWGVALVLMILVLALNIAARAWVSWRTRILRPRSMRSK